MLPYQYLDIGGTQLTLGPVICPPKRSPFPACPLKHAWDKFQELETSTSEVGSCLDYLLYLLGFLNLQHALHDARPTIQGAIQAHNIIFHIQQRKILMVTQAVMTVR